MRALRLQNVLLWLLFYRVDRYWIASFTRDTLSICRGGVLLKYTPSLVRLGDGTNIELLRMSVPNTWSMSVSMIPVYKLQFPCRDRERRKYSGAASTDEAEFPYEKNAQ